jgi:hypothetical protein
LLLVGADPLLCHAVGVGMRNITCGRGHVPLPSEPFQVLDALSFDLSLST